MRSLITSIGLTLICQTIVFSTCNAQANVDVDLMTGKAQTYIPIWSVGSGSLSSSVALAYDGGGVKPTSSEGDAGMGWNLVAGGRIYRELRGLPDDYDVSGDSRKGWLWDPGKALLASFTPTSDAGCTDWTSFNTLNDKSDLEPDIFHVSAPGLSAKFVFDNTGVPRLLPWQDLKIATTMDGSQRIASFEITDNLGTKYVFSVAEAAKKDAWTLSGDPAFMKRLYDHSLNLESYFSTWNLTSVTGSMGESITFEYTPPIQSFGRKAVRKVMSSIDVDSVFYIEQEYGSRLLSRITTTSTWVDFYWSQEESLLTAVSVTSRNSSTVRDFNLGYTSVSNASEEYYYKAVSGKRNYLTSVREQRNCESYPGYTFEYYSPQLLPYKAAYPVDVFGYYNGSSPSTEGVGHVPPVYVKHDATNGERYRIYPASGYTAIYSATTRAVNPATVHYGSLKRITFPSGGYSEVEWEPNEYRDDTAGSNQLGAGVRVKKVTTSDGDSDSSNDMIRNYSYSSGGISSGRWVYPPVFAFYDNTPTTVVSPDNLAPSESIYYSSVTLSLPANGKTVYEFTSPGLFQAGTFANGDWAATRSRIIAQPNPSCPNINISSTYYSYPFAPNVNYDFEQSLPSAVRIYTEAGVLVQEKTFAYQRLNDPNKIMVKAMKIEETGTPGVFAYGLYNILTNVDKTVQSVTTTTHDQSAPSPARSLTTSVSYTHDAATKLLYEQTTTNSDGSVMKNRTRYVADFNITNPAPSDTNAVVIKKMRDLNMHGAIIEQQTFVNSTVVAAEMVIYRDFGTARVYPRTTWKWVGTSAFTQAAVSGNPQTFTYNSSFYQTVGTTINAYNSVGRPLTTTTKGYQKAGVIYGFDKETPVAMVANARPVQILFSDFENSESYQIAASNSANAWTGVGAYQLTASTPITKTGIVKATTTTNYRFRCRAMAATAGTVNLTVSVSTGVSTWSDNVVAYVSTQPGQWLFLEKTISVSAAQQPFNVKLTSNATLTIDDVVLHPDNSQVTSVTTSNIVGKTSQTDDRGVTEFYEHDQLGRPAYVRNNDRDLVLAHEYRYKVQNAPVPRSSFTCNDCTDLLKGQSATFTAITNCMSPLTYAWYVNGLVQPSTTTTLNYTFATNREYEVQLVVSHPNYGSSSTVSRYRVKPVPLAFSLTVAENDYTIEQCDAEETFVRTFSVANLVGEYTGTPVVRWYYSTDFSNWEKLAEGTSTSFTFGYVLFLKPHSTFWIKCEVQGEAGSAGTSDPVFGTTTQQIVYVPCP